MCCLIVKPRGVEMPDYDTLRCVALANPDGFGFVSETQYHRSMSFESLYAKLKQVPKSENCIIHMRYATHGSKKVANCHPFVQEGYFFAHNGVLPIESKNDKTDSEICFKEEIMPVVKAVGLSKASRFITNLTRGTSKFAIMHSGKVSMYGHFEKMDGVYYSNLRFRYLAGYYRFSNIS